MKKIYFISLVIFAGICLNSCKSAKDISYFQNIPAGIDKVTTTQKFETLIKKGDLLSIVVSTIDPVSAAPFNLPIVSYSSPSSDQLYSQAVLQTYLVDNEGNIDFPVIGKIKLDELKKFEAIKLIQKELEPYLKNPIVNIKITNYKISVLGEVNNPGTFVIDNEKATFLEALALAGDLTIYGERTNVTIFRENNNGEKVIAKINLTTDDLFTSPFYYLQQNDIIYIEPNKTRAKLASYNPNVPIIISGISTFASVLSIIFSIANK
jgi:polysaccharide export outer membrane protein